MAAPVAAPAPTPAPERTGWFDKIKSSFTGSPAPAPTPAPVPPLTVAAPDAGTQAEPAAPAAASSVASPAVTTAGLTIAPAAPVTPLTPVAPATPPLAATPAQVPHPTAVPSLVQRADPPPTAPSPVAQAPQTTLAPVEQAKPARTGWLDKLKAGLKKTGTAIATVFTGTQIDEALYEELETALLMADTGVKATEHLLADVKRRVK
ncbi:MAG: signal recognition particle receptor subunit alpha, partial [Burkholderiales bacterium]|nr:signal recognition particle receptor subunit alpha [Burkholderiales bacterium]